MEDLEFNYKSKDNFEPSGDIQVDLYQIIKLELGYFFEDKYEESMDNLSQSSSFSQIQYYENESQTIRRAKMALKDKKILNLQKYIVQKRDNLKDGLMSLKDQKHLTTALDALEKCNKNILQLTYNISLEIKEGVLKKNNTPFDLINLYYSKKISKRYKSFQEFIEDTYALLEKAINLTYGGYNYGKKH